MAVEAVERSSGSSTEEEGEWGSIEGSRDGAVGWHRGAAWDGIGAAGCVSRVARRVSAKCTTAD